MKTKILLTIAFVLGCLLLSSLATSLLVGLLIGTLCGGLLGAFMLSSFISSGYITFELTEKFNKEFKYRTKNKITELSSLRDENKILREKLSLADKQINGCRDYLMSTQPSDLNVEDALLSLGLNEIGDIIF